ncbi:hypothetical protein RFI_30932 [Reticulomyxa filosa]|uniref:Uncharacterized protein n=1 Tax=Reticulomyxa filosa TaxID=46433 RepID=X6M0G7_RETFI|nr:hypothetical protein RFI_30932 [Reticulomyxa filosa]|eukprot:ETO06460.1 hypothetical protein RFI_30932 [Reticulomyxa filosa]
MDSSLVYENILTTLQILIVVPVVPSAKYVTRDSSKENVQIHSDNHDNMGTTTISLNMFVSYSLRYTWKSKMWKYAQSPQFCNDVKRVSLVQLKNSRIRIFKSILMIKPMQSNANVHTKMQSINIFKSTSSISSTSYALIIKSKYRKKNVHEKKKGVYLMDFLKKQNIVTWRLRVYRNLVTQNNGLGADVGLYKNSKAQFVLIVTLYVGNVELLQLYISLGAKFSICANIPIRQWCAHHRHYTIIYSSLANSQIDLQ